MFAPWPQDVADKLQIPRYVFFPSGLVYAKYLLEYDCMHERAIFEVSEDGALRQFDGQVTVPELPPLSYNKLPNLSRQRPKDALACSSSFWKSAGFVINSFQELEEELIRTWSTSGGSQPGYEKVPTIYLLGPFFLMTSTKKTPAKDGQESLNDSLMRWLDSQAPSSVLYVAFGTLASLSVEQMRELALGLEASEQHFLWAIPTHEVGSGTTSVYDHLPEGFQERVRDRAYVVTGFVPQVQILGHPSVGAFLTHAGWNSSLEAIVHGVPMITWPQAAEQKLVSRYLSDRLEIGYELQTKDSNVAGRKQVEEAVRDVLIGSTKGKKLKARVKELRLKASNAVSECGSQSKNFQEFLKDIRHAA